MKVELIEIGRVIPYARNPRKNEAAIAKVAASIKEYGFRQPIVVDEEMVIIAGHTRLQAALTLALKKVPVHVATGLTPAQIKAYRLADNRTHEDAEWDDVLGRLAHHHGKAAVRSWFSNTVITAAEGTKDGTMLTLQAPREFVRGWIEKHFLADLNHYWRDCDYSSRPVIGVQLKTKEAKS